MIQNPKIIFFNFSHAIFFILVQKIAQKNSTKSIQKKTIVKNLIKLVGFPKLQGVIFSCMINLHQLSLIRISPANLV
jgi:hypothetical protein